ncbi:MAG: lactate racemase domain-containing protein [Sphaerochaetaceae bacterium]|nr:lactate racemase domain-containing protein [Sphaerochaetaceae bacterium]
MLTDKQIKDMVVSALEQRKPKKMLMVVPDYTRCFSNAGLIANIAYHWCVENKVEVELLEALGTHVPMTEKEIRAMYGDIPLERFHGHDWRHDVVKIGEVPASFVEEVTEGLWKKGVAVEINRMVIDPSFDLVLSVGQVVPHEVIGMANQAKNFFVGAGGADMINQSHIIGAVYGMERMMGRDFTPVRKIFDYALEHFLSKKANILWMLTVCTAPNDQIQTHGLFIGTDRKPLEDAVKLSQELNIDYVETGIKKCVVYLNEKEFHSTWLGNKAVYRTRMAIADGGQLIVLAPAVDKFGEDKTNDALIRKYGYKGRIHTLELLNENADLQANMGVAAHLIHGSSDGRFSITYAVRDISQKEIADVGFIPASYEEMAKKYDPEKLKYGYNTVDGEEVFFIPNPALGLWINREKFNS